MAEIGSALETLEQSSKSEAKKITFVILCWLMQKIRFRIRQIISVFSRTASYHSSGHQRFNNCLEAITSSYRSCVPKVWCRIMFT